METRPHDLSRTPRRGLGTFALFALLAVPVFGVPSACSEAGSAWGELEELDAEAATRKQTAEKARDALAQRLLQELSDALAAGGPASGIRVCRERAPAIAAAVAEEYGVSIGRTSFRLRNPDNEPPEWAVPAVQARSAEASFYRDGAGRLGALFPIRLAPMCVQCHGPEASLSPDVRSALAQSYPSDAATGFEPGELRGWFWVEVP